MAEIAYLFIGENRSWIEKFHTPKLLHRDSGFVIRKRMFGVLTISEDDGLLVMPEIQI